MSKESYYDDLKELDKMKYKKGEVKTGEIKQDKIEFKNHYKMI